MPAILALVLASLLANVQDDADERYQFIVGLCDKGMHDLAVKEAEGFLRRHREHPRADLVRYRMASSLYDLGRSDDAAPHYRDLSGRDGFEFRAESLLRLGQCEMKAGRLPAAREAFARALGAGKDYLSIPATFLLGECAFRAADFGEAEKRYGEVLARDPESDYAKDCEYGLAWCAFRSGRHDDAIERIKRFLARRGDDALAPELRFLLGEAHLEASRPKEALEAYRSVKGGPFEDAALRGAAFSRAAQGDHAGAARDFEALLDKFPESRFAAEAALHRGVELLAAGDAKAAAEALSDKRAGASAETLYWRGRARLKAGDREASLADLDRALKAAGADAQIAERIQSVRGDVLSELGRGADAARAYEKSGSAYAVQAAAVASLNDGKPADAVRHARRLLAEHPESPYRVPALLALGEGLLAQKDAAGAEAAFREADGSAADDASRSRARARAAWCRYLQDDPAGAAKLFAAVAREFPKSAEAEEAVFMACRAFEAAGEKEAAVKAGERYLEAHGDGPHRSEVLLALSRMSPGEAGVPRLEAVVRSAGDAALVAQALYDLAERHAAAGRRADAEQRYRELLERFPASDAANPARYGLGWCLYESGRYAEAAPLLVAVAADGKAAPALKESSQELSVFALARAGSADEAAAAYRGFARAAGVAEERKMEALRAVCGALRKARRLDASRPLLDALEREAKSPSVKAAVRIERAYVALDEKKTDDAEREAREALRLDAAAPGADEALFFCAEARFDAGEDAKAADLYRLAAGAPGAAVADKALYKEGFARLRANDAEGAARAFGALVEGHPKSDLFGEGLFLEGEALFRLERFEEAAARFARLGKEVPRHEVMPKALFRRGIALCRLERWAEAVEALAELASRHPSFENSVEAELWRGRALAASGNARGARQAFDRVIARDKGVLAARARIETGRLHFAAGDVDAALSEFLKVAVLYAHPEEVSEGLFLAGKCLEKQGDLARARAQYQEIVEKHPKTSFGAASKARLREIDTAQ